MKLIGVKMEEEFDWRLFWQTLVDQGVLPNRIVAEDIFTKMDEDTKSFIIKFWKNEAKKRVDLQSFLVVAKIHIMANHLELAIQSINEGLKKHRRMP